MQKRFCAMICCVALMLSVFSGCEMPDVGEEHNPIVSQEEYKGLIADKTHAPFEEPPALCINGTKAIYETKKQYYFYPVTEDETWELLTPSLEGYEAVYVTDFEQATKREFLSGNRAVKVLLYNDTTYASLSVLFTMIPVMAIDTKQLPAEYAYHDADEEVDVEYDEEGEPIPCDLYAPPSEEEDKPIGVYDTFLEMTLLDPLGGQHGCPNGFTSLARAHIRGRSSRVYAKNNFKLELLAEENGVLSERDATLLGMRADGDWNLNGMYAEPTKVRDKVAMDLWLNITADRESTGVRNGYQGEYVEVIINGGYFGLYLLTERIDRKQLDLSDDDRLYFSEADTGKYYKDFLECEKDDTSVSGYTLDWPKERREPYDEWEPFAELTRVMAANNEEIKNKAPAMIDVDSLADYEVFIQAAAGVDNVIQNTFLVARKQDDGTYEFSFIPWDMDQTFGNRWHGEEPLLTGEDYYGMTDWSASFWISAAMKRAAAEKYFVVVRERYNALRKTVISDKALVDAVNAEYALLTDSGAYMRNKTRWPDGGYTAEVTDTTQFIVDRMRVLDQHYPPVD